MLTRADFSPITFENRDRIEEYFARCPQYHSESSIVTILSWAHCAPCSFAEYKNHLIITCTMDGETGIHTPIGTRDPELFKELLSFARKENFSVEIFEEETRNRIKETYPQIPITENRNYFEYCYSTESLANLKGKKYLNIRGQINTFNARWKYRVEKISAENIREVTELVSEWAREKQHTKNTILNEEITAAQFSLEHWDKLPLEGIAIRIEEDNRLAGMAVWEIQNKDAALIHFEKGLLQYPGIYKIINKETARKLLGKVRWINRESDMGEPGLREAKLRYHPEYFVKAYYIPAEDIPETLS